MTVSKVESPLGGTMTVIVLNEARTLLAGMRKNALFSPWTALTNEHTLVRGLKDLTRWARDCESNSTKLGGALEVLNPFLDIITSEEANSIITSSALGACERIIARVLDQPGLPGAREALQSVLSAASSCKYVPTETSQDELVSLGIIRLISVAVLGTAHGALLSDADIGNAILVIMRIHLKGRNSAVLRAVSLNVLEELVAHLVEHCTAPEHGPEQFSNLAPLTADLRKIILQVGQEVSPRGLGLSKVNQWGSASVVFVLYVLSSLVGTLETGSITHKVLGLRLLDTALSSRKIDSLVSRIDALRQTLLKECSRVVLGILVDRSEEATVISLAFGVSHLLMKTLGPHAGALISFLARVVFPQFLVSESYVSLEAHGNDHAAREIGLEAISTFVMQQGFLPILYASMDCNPRSTDGVRLLTEDLKLLAQKCEDGETDKKEDRLHSTLTHQRNAALWATEHLVRITENMLFLSQSATALPLNLCAECGWKVESMPNLRDRRELKGRLNHVARKFSQGGGKTGGRGLIALLREIGPTGHRLSKGNTKSSALDYTEQEIMEAVTFLKDNAGLDKAAIGVALSEPDPVSQKILCRFCRSFDLRSGSFIDCIRRFLESFRLPGEAQKIDRIMHSFATAYYDQTESLERGKLGLSLRSADAAFVLAFSVVMLNTDLHNSSVRRKMTLEDFIRNNRGINDGEDLPRSSLEEIYRSIEANQIRITGENKSLDLSLRLWDSEVSLELSPLVIPKDWREAAEDVFRLTWNATTKAAVFFLSDAHDSTGFQSALEALLTVARCGVAFRTTEPVDAVLDALCEATGLLKRPHPVDALRFGMTIKAQMATVTMFGVARECGDWVRSTGWESILGCLVRLHLLDLLPNEFKTMLGTYGDELVDSTGRPLPPSKVLPVWWPGTSQSPPSRGSWSIDPFTTTLFSFLSLAVEDSGNASAQQDRSPPHLPSESPDDEDARELGQRCISDCHVYEILVEDTRFLSIESFESLLQALTRLALRITLSELERGGTLQHTSTAKANMDDSKDYQLTLSLLLDLLGELTLRNRDRLHVVWPHCHDLIIRTLAPAREATPSLERAVVNLLRIAIRCLQRDEIRDDLLRTLNLLVKLPLPLASSVSTPLAAGVHQIVKVHSSHIHSTSGWHTILSVIEGCARFADPAPRLGFESLQFLLHAKAARHSLRAETFSVFLDAVHTFASSTLPMSMEAIDLLGQMTYRIGDVTGSRQSEGAGDQGAAESNAKEARWAEYWGPNLMAISQLCRDDRGDSRNHAIRTLEEILGHDGVTSQFDWDEKVMLFQIVLIPLAKDIYNPDGRFASRATVRRRLETQLARQVEEEESSEDKTRSLLMSLITKLYLEHYLGMFHHLDQACFDGFWRNLLRCYLDALNPESGSSMSLCTTFTEHLKAILRVSHESGILVQEREELWSATRRDVRSIIPNLSDMLSRPPVDSSRVTEPPTVPDSSAVDVDTASASPSVGVSSPEYLPVDDVRSSST